MFSKLDPENLVLAVTSRCNSRCSHCHVRKGNEDMNFETAWKAVSLFLERNADHSCRQIKFFGGEPLLCFELIKDIVKEANTRYKNIKFKLPTNGVLIDKKVIKFLSDNPNVELVISSNNIGSLGRKKSLIKEILSLPLATISINFLPAKIKEGEKKFVELHERGFSRFNFLPAYFTSWTRNEITLLKKSLKRITDIISSSPRKFYIGNLEIESTVPLFNLAPTIDQKGNIMAGNFFLDERFFRWKDELKLGNVENMKDWNKVLDLSFDFDFLIEKIFLSDVIGSNMAVDRELSRFVNYLITEK